VSRQRRRGELELLAHTLVRGLHELLGDQRAADRRGERVLVLIQRVGQEGPQAVVLGELLFRIDGDGSDGA